MTERKAPQIAGLETALRDRFLMLAGLFEVSGDPYSSSVLEQRAPDLAKAYVKVAKRNPAFARLLIGLTTGSELGEAVLLTAGTVIPILAHRGVIPQDTARFFTFGLVPPSDEVQDHAAAAAGEPVTPPAPAPGYPGAATVEGARRQAHPGRDPESVGEPLEPEGKLVELGDDDDAASQAEAKAKREHPDGASG